MKTLNLVYPEKSDIQFHDGLGNIGKTAKFPDGQQDIVIEEIGRNIADLLVIKTEYIF